MGLIDGFIEKAFLELVYWFKLAFVIYNKLTGMAAGMLGQDPAAWNPGGWELVEGVNTVFMSIAAVLVVIFFLMGFCADSMDIRQDFRLENILRMFIKLLIAEFFVTNSLELVKGFFGLGTGIVQKLSGAEISFEFSVPPQIDAICNDPLSYGISRLAGVLSVTLLYDLAIVFLLVVSGCGMMILYEAFQRFIKILLLVPYGTLANSTLAGNHTLNRSAEAFWKYALGTILDAVTMYMALAISAAVLKSGTVSLTENQTGIFYIIAWIIESTFICMLTLGMVKGASTVTQKALGL